MPQKAVAQPRPGMSALDQAGDIGQDQTAAVDLRDPQIGLQGRERIVGGLRTGFGESRQQSRLAGVRSADDPDVGQQAQLQLEASLLPGLAPLGDARRLQPGGGEASVTPTAPPATGHD